MLSNCSSWHLSSTSITIYLIWLDLGPFKKDIYTWIGLGFIHSARGKFHKASSSIFKLGSNNFSGNNFYLFCNCFNFHIVQLLQPFFPGFPQHMNFNLISYGNEIKHYPSTKLLKSSTLEQHNEFHSCNPFDKCENSYFLL